jgi:hypothetical protein
LTTCKIVHGDCLQVMAVMEANSIDAIVCDPPYGLSFMGRNWDHEVPGPAFWKEALRVAKPGAFLVAFGGTRKFHRLMAAIEDGGWELRDTISGELVTLRWEYGSGFPKSHNVSKGIDRKKFGEWLAAHPEQAAQRKRLLGWAAKKKSKKWREVTERSFVRMAGLERQIIGTKRGIAGENLNDIVRGSEVRSTDDDGGRGLGAYGVGAKQVSIDVPVTQGASEEARQWDGWGTALKPSWEPIVVCSKPLTIEQHFAIVVRGLTRLICEVAGCHGLSASDVERASTAIQARLQKGLDDSVLESARTSVLESYGLAPYADANFTFNSQGSIGPIGTRDDSVRLPARPVLSADHALEKTIRAGVAEDIPTRLMAMCTSVMMEGISENIVSSWSGISADLLIDANTFTTETASKLTIALRTLRSLMPPLISIGTGDSFPNGYVSAWEPIVLARKPLEGSVAENVLAHGTGGLNIDACRIDASAGRPAREVDPKPEANGAVYEGRENGGGRFDGGSKAIGETTLGRWPANLVLMHTLECEPLGAKRIRGSHRPGENPDSGAVRVAYGAYEEHRPSTYTDEDGLETIEAWDCHPECPVRRLDEQSGELTSGDVRPGYARGNDGGYHGNFGHIPLTGFGDSGGASRFFYTAKASRSEREAGLHGRDARNVNDGRKTSIDNPYQRGDTQRLNTHATVKPVDLMRWLARLVCRKGGTVLDPFCGSGTTGVASKLEGMNFVGIDLEAEHVEIARKRCANASIDVGEATVQDAEEVGGVVQLGLFGGG